MLGKEMNTHTNNKGNESKMLHHRWLEETNSLWTVPVLKRKWCSALLERFCFAFHAARRKHHIAFPSSLSFCHSERRTPPGFCSASMVSAAHICDAIVKEAY